MMEQETDGTGRIRATLVMPESAAGSRLDQALAELLPEHSRSRLKSWLEAGGILVDGEQRRPRDKVTGGETVVVDVDLPAAVASRPEEIHLPVVWEDSDLIVVNKPAGLVVHPGAGNSHGTLMNGLLHAYPECRQLPRAGIVHRLDRQTTGLMVVARSLEAHTSLVAMLSDRAVTREYLAVCIGVLTGGGTVDAPLARHHTDRKRMAVRDGGKEAITHYRLVERYRGHSLIRCRLETGRTHQIRVHMTHIRHPLLGDPVYCGRMRLPKGASDALIEAIRTFKRQALHATALTLQHPITGEVMTWQAELPEDMGSLVAALAHDAAA
jgi:23S rRNA pseudouridine1911/1915/1917 synthase